MVDNAPDDYRRKLKKLSKREAQVLVLRCQGMNYAAIGKVLSIAVPTVKTDMGRIYVKLGLDVLERSVRHKVLYDAICPLLKVRKPAHEKEEKEPEDVVEGEEVTEEEEEIPIPEKVMEMVEYDGREIVPWHPESLVVVPPSPGRTGRRIWPVVLVLGVILGIFLGGGAVYLIFGPGKGSLPFVGPPTATVSPPTAFPSAIPSPLPSREVIPSNTPLQSTDTPVPPRIL